MISIRRSVRGRFLRITVPLIFLSVLGIFTAIEIISHRGAMARLKQTSEAVLLTQSAALANPLWNIDDEQVALSLQAIATNPEILVVRVYGEKDEILSQAGDETALSGDELRFRREIVYDTGTGPRQIGEIEFFVTQGDIWTQTRARLLLAAGIALAAVAMEVGAALFALRRIVGAPLERLLAAINAAKTGGARPRVNEGAPDEMGQVISAFNEMLAQQEVYEADLQVQARMESELKIGRDMQLSMVPRDFDALAQGRSLSLWAALEPAREVGGDFYDAFPVNDSTLCIVIGDVSDKGVPAALMMAVTKTMIKSFAIENAEPNDVVTSVNEELCRGDHQDMFVTLFVAMLNPKTGALTYCNAGHNPPLRLDSAGQVTAVPDRNGPVVGALAGLAYTQSEAQLAAGETLVLYTDGVTEASDESDRMFGDAALGDLLAGMAAHSARDIVEGIVRTVEAHEGSADRTDDITVLAVTFWGVETLRWRGSAPASLQAVSRLGEEMAKALGENATDLAARAQMILDEIGSNVVNHASAGPDGPVEIVVEVTCLDQALSMMVSDTGPAFDPASVPEPDISLSVEDRAVGGLGLQLVRSLSQTFHFAREHDKNTYRITIH